MPIKRRRSVSVARRYKRARSNFRKKSWRMKYTRGKSRLARAIKSVVLKTAEKKWKSVNVQCNTAYDNAKGGYPLNHNSIVEGALADQTNPLLNSHITAIVQGVSDVTRNGSSIYSKGIMLRGSINVPWDRKGAKFKIYLLEYNTAQGTPTTFNDLFSNITGKVVLDPFQPDRWKPKYLATYHWNAADTNSAPTGGKDVGIDFKKWIPYKRQFHYQGDGSASIARGIKEKLSLIMLSYDCNAALETDTIGYIRLNATLHFADP